MGRFPRMHHFVGMTQSSLTLPFPNVQLTSFALIDDVWVVEAASIGTVAACPRCLVVSTARHSSYVRRFWDLPIQGRPVRIRLTVGRWRCRNTDCGQSIFTERLPGMVAPRARQTGRAAAILRLLGHGIGGRPGARFAARLGFVGNRTTILRHLIRHQLLPDRSAPRVVGLDEWAARKGTRFGTIAVDLERRRVIDVLPDRSAVSAAAWLAQRSRRQAQGPLQRLFARVRELFRRGWTVADIGRNLDINRRRVDK